MRIAVLFSGLAQPALAQAKGTLQINDSQVLSSLGVKFSMTTILLAAAGLVVIGIVVAILLLVGKRRRPEKGRAEAMQATVQGTGAKSPAGSDDRTMDSFAAGGSALGALVILQSDDPSMLNQRIDINHPVTHLGRKADNEVIFAKDSPVSRRHAVIEARDGSFFLAEIHTEDEHTGQPKRPAYGTFVNGVQVQGQVILQDGDEIILGRRLRMRFEALQISPGGADSRPDEVSPGPDDKTIAAFTSGKAKVSDSDITLPSASPGKQPGAPGSNDITLVAGTANKPQSPGDHDKTLIPGGGQR